PPPDPTEIDSLPLHDALPIYAHPAPRIHRGNRHRRDKTPLRAGLRTSHQTHRPASPSAPRCQRRPRPSPPVVDRRPPGNAQGIGPGHPRPGRRTPRPFAPRTLRPQSRTPPSHLRPRRLGQIDRPESVRKLRALGCAASISLRFFLAPGWSGRAYFPALLYGPLAQLVRALP